MTKIQAGAQSYNVQKGDCLWNIAKQKLAADKPAGSPKPTAKEIAATVKDFARISGVKNPNVIRPGQQITFGGGGQPTAQAGRPATTARPAISAPRAGNPPAVATAPVPARPNMTKIQAGDTSYVVKKGDCLWNIAKQKLAVGRQAGTPKPTAREVFATVKEFSRDNNLNSHGLIKPGQKISIQNRNTPGSMARAAAPSPARVERPVVSGVTKPYTIKSGDTLGGIARRQLTADLRPSGRKPTANEVNTAVLGLAKSNHITNPNLIVRGRTIQV